MGDRHCRQNLQFLLGRFVAEGRDAGTTVQVRTKKAACVRTCVLRAGDRGGGHKGLSAARVPMRGRPTSGMGGIARTGQQESRQPLPLCGEKPFPPLQRRYTVLLQQQPAGPPALGESPGVYSLHSSSSNPRHSLFWRAPSTSLFSWKLPAARSRGSGAETAAWR